MKKPCEFCNGSGQINFFKGVSRFLLSCEECPECAGMGFKIASDENCKSKEKNNDNNTPPNKKKG